MGWSVSLTERRLLTPTPYKEGSNEKEEAWGGQNVTEGSLYPLGNGVWGWGRTILYRGFP